MLNLSHPARSIPPPRPVDPAGAVDHAQIAWPTAPWTAPRTRRPQAPQALHPGLSQEELRKKGTTRTTEGGNFNVLIGGKLGVLLTLRRFWRHKATRREGLLPEDALFCSQSRTRISPRRVQFAFRTWQQKAGFDRLYPFHSLRHYAASSIMPARRSDGRLFQGLALSRAA